MNQKNKLVIVGVVGVVAVIALLFWFNRYSFSEMKLGDNTYPVRTSRFTDESEINVMGNWTKVGAAAQPSNTAGSSKAFALSAEDLRKLDGKAGTSLVFDGATHHILQCSIYNGTLFALSDVTIRLNVEAGDSQSALTRDYKLTIKTGGAVPSLANGSFEAEVGLDLSKAKWNWGIVSATGLK